MKILCLVFTCDTFSLSFVYMDMDFWFDDIIVGECCSLIMEQMIELKFVTLCEYNYMIFIFFSLTVVLEQQWCEFYLKASYLFDFF